MRNLAASLHAVTDTAVRALAVFAAASLGLGVISHRWSGTWLWIQGGALPDWLVSTLAATFALSVLFLARIHRLGRLLAQASAVLLAVACFADTVSFYRLRASGDLHASASFPLSLALGALLLAWVLTAKAATRPDQNASAARTRRALWLRVADRAGLLVVAGLGLLAHLLAFGASDYRRPADAAVVFGAAVRADGRASQALFDRTKTACALYHEGLVDRLVLSGGRDPAAPLSEPACMSRIARRFGVPQEALVLDETGSDTAATIRSAVGLVRDYGWRRVLMVSHDYHLARIKLVSHRAGLEAFTVPALESRRLVAKPYFVARELAAWAWYFLRPDLQSVAAVQSHPSAR